MQLSKEITKIYPFARHQFTLPDLNIEGDKQYAMNYVDEGPKDASNVLLMLHGNPTWSFFYRNLIKKFSSGQYNMRCIAPDHLGMGLSSKPQEYNYSLKNHIDNLEKLIQSLNIKQFYLAVHDWGGAIGMGLATRRPDLIKGVIIMNTAAFLSDNIPKRIAGLRTPLIGESIIRHLNGFAYPATFMAVKKKMPAAVKAGYLAPYKDYQTRIAIDRFVKDIPLEPAHQSYHTLQEIESRLANITCPKLLLWGAEDFCFDQTFYAKWKAIYPEIESHLIKHAGHYLLEDEPELTLGHIEKFLLKQMVMQ